MIRNKNKRDLSWFFESKLSSINSLPPYLELYFQLFIDSFSPENELQKRYIFLIWAYFSDHNSSVLKEINNDNEVNEILLKDYDRDNVYYDIKMKNYQYFYYVENEEFFKQNEISINNIVGKRKLLLWFLTYRDDLKNLNFLLKKELEELKEDSKKYVLEGFTISKYFELIIDTKEFLKEDYSAGELEAIISFVLFNYKSYKYILTQTQIDELTNGKIYYFINIYKRIYDNDLEVNFNVHDKIKKILDVSTDFPIELELIFNKYNKYNKNEKNSFLLWAYFSDHNSSVLKEINNDNEVNEILLKDYDRDNVYYDIKMKNYQYFYYVENEEFFKQNEISINNIVGKRKLLLWFLTYRDDLKNLNFLLKKELEELKEDSKKYVLEGFTISKYFELIIDTKEFLKEDYSAGELEAIISFVLFNYKSYKYILTQTQIDELTNGKIYYFINIYKRIYDNDLEVNFLENLDIPPLLINYLKKVIDVKK